MLSDDHPSSPNAPSAAAPAAAVAAPSAASRAAGSVCGDRFAFIRIEGMHCHRCELAIQKTLQRIPGVHEVEVDFATGQASILFDPTTVATSELIDGVKQAGYKPIGLIQGDAASAAYSITSNP